MYLDVLVVVLAPDCFDVIDVANHVACHVCNCVALGVHVLPAVGSMLAQEGLVPRIGKEVAVFFTVAAVRRSHGCRQRIVLIL